LWPKFTLEENIKTALKQTEREGGSGLNSSGSGQGPAAGSSEHGNKSSGYTTGGGIPRITEQLFISKKKRAVPWNSITPLQQQFDGVQNASKRIFAFVECRFISMGQLLQAIFKN
jgi:hypothetical protein